MARPLEERKKEILRENLKDVKNTSAHFNDGNQLGLGAEIGINTSKLHAFGPKGLEDLTTTKFVVFGNGQIRS